MSTSLDQAINDYKRARAALDAAAYDVATINSPDAWARFKAASEAGAVALRAYRAAKLGA